MGLFVVGMHRSGTSALTGVLAGLPFELPPAELMVGANDSNPRGHWEVERLTDFDEVVLERLGSTWAAPREDLGEGLAGLIERGVGDEALGVFTSCFETEDWLFKDPRLCLVLPLWRAALGDHPTVLVVRNPIGVAASLRRRNGLPLTYGLALWERYQRTALRVIEGLPTYVVSYGDLLDGDVEGLVSFAKGALATEAPVSGPEDRAAATDFGLVSHPVDEAAALTDPRLSAEQRGLLEHLVSRRGRHERWSPGELGPETPNIELAFTALRSAGGRGVEEVSERLDHAVADWVAEAERLRTLAAAAEVAFDRARYGSSDDVPAGRAGRLLWSAIGTERYRRVAANPEVQDVAHRARLALGRLRGRRSARSAAPAATPTPTSIAIAAGVRAGRLDRPLTVIVPIYNATDDVARCLDALERFTPEAVRILLVDDASTDPRLRGVLDRATLRHPVTVLRNSENLGYTRSVNRGLAVAATGDVILLNSDTVVTARWTSRLRTAALEDPTRATITAFSNAAGEFSFDVSMPVGLDRAAAVAVAVARGSARIRPEAPTGNGFCMLITAEARAAGGLFDEDAFPRAYGEENDYCMRLRSQGFTHVIADDCVVFHNESASYGAARDELVTRAMDVLGERWPDYHELARRFTTGPELASARRVATAAAAAAGARVRRVLYVIHDGHGGTEFHVDDLTGALVQGGADSCDVEVYRLISTTNGLEMERHDAAGWTRVQRWVRPEPWDVRRFRDDRELAIAADILLGWDFDLVHVHHLVGHTFDLVELASALGIGVVVTAHDFYTACPSLNLLDDQVRFCGGRCTPGDGRCQVPELWISPDLPLKHRFVHLWQEETRSLWRGVDRMIAPSADTAAHYQAIFGDDLPTVTVIEHGRDVERAAAVAHQPAEDEPIRLVLVGAIGVQKGGALVPKLARCGGRRGVSVEALGEIAPELGDLPVPRHGVYTRERLTARLAGIRPAFIGVLSPWPETHCYVISEAWAAGVPVVVGPIGAQAERVRRHGGGIVLDSLEPEDVIDAVVRVGRDPVRYGELAASARVGNLRTVAEMAADHRTLYDELW